MGSLSAAILLLFQPVASGVHWFSLGSLPERPHPGCATQTRERRGVQGRYSVGCGPAGVLYFTNRRPYDEWRVSRGARSVPACSAVERILLFGKRASRPDLYAVASTR